jgi:hypothetical protein
MKLAVMEYEEKEFPTSLKLYGLSETRNGKWVDEHKSASGKI